MAFAHPEILWGLWGLAIPVIIHLLNFRRYRKVAFSQVAFLQELQRETRSTQAIRHWLVLLMRLLAVAALVLAFAQPYLPAAEADDEMASGNVVALYIDNSPSMEALGEEGALLQVAVEKAIRVVEGHAETDRFLVQTNAFTPRDTRLLTRDEALQRLTEIGPSPIARHITDVMARSEGALLSIEGRRRSAYLFTDLQRSTHDLEALERRFVPDTSIAFRFIPQMAPETVNAWVDSVWFDAPTRLAGRPAALRVRIRHNARAGVSGLPLELRINGARAAIGSYNLVPGLATDTVLRFTHGEPGLKSATVSIEDAPIRFDDDFHFGFRVTDVIDVVHFTEEPTGPAAQAIRRVYKTTGDQHRVQTAGTFSLDALAQADFVVVSDWPAPTSGMAEALRGFVDRGGSCLWIPDSLENGTNSPVRKALGFGERGRWQRGENRVSSIVTDHPLFAGVFRKMPRSLDLPGLAFTLDRSLMPQEELLIRSEQGPPFLSRVGVGEGSAYLLGATIDEAHSNFTRHALFVPLMLRLAERARHTPLLFGTVGLGDPLHVPGGNNTIGDGWTLRGQGDQGRAWQPAARNVTGGVFLSLENGPQTAGLYDLMRRDSVLHTLGMNADRRESSPAAFDVPTWQAMCTEAQWLRAKTLEADTEAMAAVTQQLRQGTPLWKSALLMSLLALLIESILLRKWKRTSS